MGGMGPMNFGMGRQQGGMGGMGGVDQSGKIGRQVGWLNKHGNLHDNLSLDAVVGPLSGLDVTSAMAILKEVEVNSASIFAPTQYVIEAAAARAGGAGKPQGLLDPTGKISRQVGWLNKHVPWASEIVFNDIAEPLSSLNITAAMSILKNLETAAKEAQVLGDPNQFILLKCAEQGAGQSTISASQADPTGKIGRQVQWLNKHANLVVQIDFNSIIEPLSQLEVSIAMKILKEIEQAASGGTFIA